MTFKHAVLIGSMVAAVAAPSAAARPDSAGPQPTPVAGQSAVGPDLSGPSPVAAESRFATAGRAPIDAGPLETPAPTVVRHDDNGFDVSSALIGATLLGGVLGLGILAAPVVGRRRNRSSSLA
jgi:hypothetical protein